MAKRGRRVREEEPEAERRLRPVRESDAGRGGPASEVLRLQQIAGNSAVSSLVRSLSIQRDEGSAPAKTEEKPKESGYRVVVEDEQIEPFAALSFQFVSPRGPGTREGEKTPQEVSITKRADKNSVVLHQRTATGEPFPRVTIEAGGMTIVMTNVVISNFSVGSSQDEPMESVVFNAAELEVKHEGS